MPKDIVLVTGGSGFIAGHVILQLLEKNYLVRTTIRSLARQGEVAQVLKAAGAKNLQNLEFVAADLMEDAGWSKAVTDARYVIHVASPVSPGHVKNEDEVIRPAREGTMRVLEAARDANVKRVVLTSAFHAVSWGHPHSDHVFTEADWTVLDGRGVDAYGKSKTIAERSAWDFMVNEGAGTELTTILPVAVMGPVMGKAISGSNHAIERLLSGAMPAMPDIYIPIVDVRDVAAAHIAAMTTPEAAGERFLISNGPALSMADIAAILKRDLGDGAKRVPTRVLPNFVLRLVALFNPEARAIVPDLGYAKKTSNEKARRILGWTPRAPEEAIASAGRSMLDRHLIEQP